MVIVVGMACVIGVLLSMLSLASGLFASFAATGDPQRVIITATEARNENLSNIPRSSIPIIQNAPGIMKMPDGAPFDDASLLTNTPAFRKAGDLAGRLSLRGFGPRGIALRPEIKLIDGRMFRPGTRELIVGVGARSQFIGLELGQKVTLPDGDWPIVGVFSAGGTTLDGNLIGDVETVLAAVRRNNFSSVLLRLDSAPDSYNKLEAALTTNPTLSVRVERQTEYYARQEMQYAIFDIIAYSIGGIMALGALFGTLNTMYAAVNSRTREIATLRALGFGPFPVAVSVIAESMLLALTGAAIGSGIAWFLYNGTEDLYGTNYFRLMVTPASMATGMIWTMVIALLGGLLPSIRAARSPIVAGLRAV